MASIWQLTRDVRQPALSSGEAEFCGMAYTQHGDSLVQGPLRVAWNLSCLDNIHGIVSSSGHGLPECGWQDSSYGCTCFVDPRAVKFLNLTIQRRFMGRKIVLTWEQYRHSAGEHKRLCEMN
jgi:hypothetical protein